MSSAAPSNDPEVVRRRGAADISFYRGSAPYFAAMLLLAVPAFWPSYIQPKAYEADYHVHLHGIALFLWSVMLIAQPLLISMGRLAVHRRIGKLSYGLAPTVVLSTLLLAHYRISREHPPDQLYFLYVQLGLIALFTYAYVQGIRHRKSPGIHARYMVCTAFTMFDPIVARLLYIYFGIEPPLMQILTYGSIDAILAGLWIRDLRRGNGIGVFGGMLALFVIFEVPTFFLPQSAAWEAFALWYGRLPLP